MNKFILLAIPTVASVAVSATVVTAQMRAQSATPHQIVMTDLMTAEIERVRALSSLNTMTASSGFITMSSAVPTSGFVDVAHIVVSSNGLAVQSPPPRNAQWHAVTDTYYDEQGRVVGKETTAHQVDPFYCQPGHRLDLVAHTPMPAPLRQLLADNAIEMVVPETVVPTVRYAEAQ